MDQPVRLDFFGDTIETIRSFDPDSQRTTDSLRGLDLVPVSEFQLTTETIKKFRMAYVELFGTASNDQLYEAVSEGRRYPGMEHWLPLFTGKLDTLFDYVPGTPVVLEPLADDAAHERLTQIADYYEARKQPLEAAGGTPYHPLKPDRLYLTESEWQTGRDANAVVRLSPFADPDPAAVDAGMRQGPQLRGRARATECQRVRGGARPRTDAAIRRQKSRDRVVERRRARAHGARIGRPQAFQSHQCAKLARRAGAAEAADRACGARDRKRVRDRRRRGHRRAGHSGRPAGAAAQPRKADNFIAEATMLAAGDLVVHVDHGIGRFIGLTTVEAAGAPHDCLELHYAGGDKLFLPVENIELLSRYGSEDNAADLDRLGSGGWQTRKARMKSRIREIAAELIKIAAERQLREAEKFAVGVGPYDEFAAGFPYEETEDQQAAIDAVIADLGKGRPMDRLICGDVGFGKTEVALRAAFLVAMSGKQVAVVVPTTLLARQHFKTFSERFRGYPLKVAQASRLVTAKEMSATRAGLTDGSVDIVVGTHAILGKQIKFRDLGLVVVDEEQHFGVAHKERLKSLRAEVHCTDAYRNADPRTLQLALTGVRELSIIASPPVDRLAVRTFVAPFDPLTVREAILRERYRGGQAFYVCPRIEDIAGVKDFFDKTIPEARVVVAHGQMPPTVLEDVMTAFYDGKYDVLLSTTIVESGLDIPTANTLIVHRADMFGLAQLYQLRGRVGRSKTRAYALFTLPTRKITPQAERRLKVLQSLDTLGAAFQLASHDLDIRGAGNLLGDEQSGHIKEVGFELYQADAGGGGGEPQGGDFRAGRRPLVAADIHRHAGSHSGRVRRRPVGAAGALPEACRSRGPARDRQFRRGADRPLWPDAGRGAATPRHRRHQGAVPTRQCSQDRRRPEGRGAVFPRRLVRQSGRTDRVHPEGRAGPHGCDRT